MWQSPTSRTRAATNEKNKKKLRMRRALKLQRAEFEIRIAGSDKVLAGRILVSDIDPDGGIFYSTIPIVTGTEITLTLKEPYSIVLKAQVAWSQEQTSSYKVMSVNPFHFRTALNFRFENAAQEEAFGNICAEISGEKVAKPAGAKPVAVAAAPAAPDAAEAPAAETATEETPLAA